MTDELDVPEAYDDDSFRAGYAKAMAHIGHMALSGADGIAPPGESLNQQSGGDGGDSLVKDDDACRNCDAPLLDSMGADETDHSPGGKVCPSCDL